MNLYYELDSIKNKISKQTYRTILGQLNAGDYKGAEKGIKKVMNRRKQR